MRLFVGIEFPPPILDQLADCQKLLRGSARRGRFKRRENFHLTLKFLEVPAAQVAALTGPLAAAASRFGPFRLRLGTLGQFGGGPVVRTVWLAVRDDEAGSLGKLQASVERGLAAVGCKPEIRRWRPHITVAQDVEFSGGGLPAVALPGAQFDVGEFALILSEERERRRIYTPLQRFALGSPSPGGKGFSGGLDE